MRKTCLGSVFDRDANNSWAVPDVLYNPQALNNFPPGSRKVWEPSPSAELRGLALPEAAGAGCPWGGGAAAGPPRDLLQQCLWAAGITEQLLEAEAQREPGSFQPPPQPAGPAAPRSGPQLCQAALGRQPPLSTAGSAQPFVQHLGPFASLHAGSGPAQLEGQQGMATALPAPQVVFLQQVPQRIMLQVKQPAPTTLVLFPGPASCVLGSGQGPGPPAHKPSSHPHSATPSSCGHQHPGAPAPQHSSIPTPKAVGIELWHGESFWSLEPNWGKVDSFVSYF
ncbi:BRD4-interacting chromatin-remodeling complex-associated protein-like [Corvus moneduloides]|uniref:BRD4-interacting chromatin-remodeling complex-associated protein-like n=1 Tax=Corvus moneduloides TaxID=1196302 RepID=UPI0013645B19|nr:BRD4-interacting chromatin-remodeling complex-associated protein-like [Corvus moneduloides]